MLARPDSLTGAFDSLYFRFVASIGTYPAAGMTRCKAILRQRISSSFASTAVLYPALPIRGMMHNKVTPARVEEIYQGRTQCGASTPLFNVMPDGRISPWPDLP